MKMTTPKYLFCLIGQLSFMMIDVFLNCLSLFPRGRNGLIVLFIFQDLALVLSLVIMMMTFFSTYLFQAGLLEVLIRKYRVAVTVAASYVVASVLLQVVWLMEKWANTEATSSPKLMVLIILHRCMSPWYYFFYKRAALSVSDPRFYDDIDWINRHVPTH